MHKRSLGQNLYVSASVTCAWGGSTKTSAAAVELTSDDLRETRETASREIEGARLPEPVLAMTDRT
jgi:hypothetical protein